MNRLLNNTLTGACPTPGRFAILQFTGRSNFRDNWLHMQTVPGFEKVISEYTTAMEQPLRGNKAKRRKLRYKQSLYRNRFFIWLGRRDD